MASINLQGDTSGTITISAPSVAGSNTLTLPATTQTLATQNALGVRNLIINGDMRIDQRNSGNSVTPSNNDYCLDRYGTGLAQASKYSVQQVTDAPTNFTHSLKVTSLSAYTLLSGDYFMIKHKIEGNNVAHLNLGSANAQEFTLSFYVKSSLTGTFGGSFENSNESRAYPFTYTISSANTWERVSVTVTGDTTGTWLTNNSTGLWINFGLGVGTTYSGTSGAWAAGPLVSATGATSVVSTNAATWQITGVQLEVGDTATPFEHRPYDMELQRCMRYFQRLPETVEYLTAFYFDNPSRYCTTVYLPVVMRTSTQTITYGTAEYRDGSTYTNGTYLNNSRRDRLLTIRISCPSAPNSGGYALGLKFVGTWTLDAEL